MGGIVALKGSQSQHVPRLHQGQDVELALEAVRRCIANVVLLQHLKPVAIEIEEDGGVICRARKVNFVIFKDDVDLEAGVGEQIAYEGLVVIRRDEDGVGACVED